jgi:hypothetical protein
MPPAARHLLLTVSKSSVFEHSMNIASKQEVDQGLRAAPAAFGLRGFA